MTRPARGAIALLILVTVMPVPKAAGQPRPPVLLEGLVGAQTAHTPDGLFTAAGPLEGPGDLLLGSGRPTTMSSYVRAQRKLLARAWGVPIISWRNAVEEHLASAEESGEAPTERVRVPLTTNDIDGDGHDDVLFFDIGLDENSFSTDIRLTALEGRTGEQLWSETYGTPYDVLVFSPGDVTGDDADDLLILVIERTIHDSNVPCSPGMCAYDNQLTFRSVAGVLSGATGERVWQRAFDGVVRYTGGLIGQGPARQEVVHLEGTDALFDIRVGGDLSGDGLSDFVINVLDFSGEIVFSQLVPMENLRYSTQAEAITGDTGAVLTTRSQGNQLGTPLLVPTGDATGDGRADLLWTRPTSIRPPSACTASTGCIRQRRGILSVDLVDGASGESIWAADMRDLDQVAAAPLMTRFDLTGDDRADIVLGLASDDGAERAVVLSGVDGSVVWTLDTILTDPPTALPSIDGGAGRDILFWEGWEPENEPDVIFRIRLRRVDGATGTELFATERELVEGPDLESIFAHTVGDVDGDSVLDIGHSEWRYTGPWEASGTASTLMSVESGRDGTELLRATRDRKSLLFPGGDWVPGGGLDLFEGSVPYNDRNFRLAAIEMPSGNTMWQRTDVLFTALFGALGNQDDGDDIVYGRTQVVAEEPRVRSRIDVLDGSTGRRIWGLGPLLVDDSEPTPAGSPSTATPSPTLPTEPEGTTLRFEEDSARQGQVTDRVDLEARLSDAGGDPLEGAEVTFTLTGAGSERTFAATTDEQGFARVSPRLNEAPGAYHLTVRFDGNGDHSGSADITPFVVQTEDTHMELSIEGAGSKRRLIAALSDLDSGEGVAGRGVDFYSDDVLLGSLETDEMGVAGFDPNGRHQGGKHSYEVRFDGDEYFRESSARRQT